MVGTGIVRKISGKRYHIEYKSTIEKGVLCNIAKSSKPENPKMPANCTCCKNIDLNRIVT